MEYLYTHQNDIYYDNVIERSKISEIIKSKEKELDAFALVFIDDFIRTGNSASEYFKRLTEEHGMILKRLTKVPTSRQQAVGYVSLRCC